MNSSPTSQAINSTEPSVASEWPIKLLGGTVVGKFRWYLRLAGLILLGLVVSIAIGVIVGLLANSGDVGILTALAFFIASVFVALAFVKRRVARLATLRLSNESLKIVTGNSTIVNWPGNDVGRVDCNWIASGVGIAAVIPSDFCQITIEHRKSKSVVFELHREAALACVATMKPLTANAIYTGPMIEPHVPTNSDCSDQVWRTKLRSEFRDALKEIAFGLFGSAYLCLFSYGILTGKRPQGDFRFIILMILIALVGPFLLYLGVRHMFTYNSRRRRFSKLSKQGRNDLINELISEIYGSQDSPWSNVE